MTKIIGETVNEETVVKKTKTISDHFFKTAAGGKTELANLQILCRACHDYKDNNGKPPMRILMLYWNK